LNTWGRLWRPASAAQIRGFGSFALHYRPPRVGRNPKSGDPVSLPAKYVPHFKPGKELRERVNLGAATAPEIKLARGGDNDGDGDSDNDSFGLNP